MNAAQTDRTTQVKTSAAVVQVIAQEVAAPVSLVQRVYEEEYAMLSAHARLTQFLDVLASRRAKQRLRANGHGRRE